MARAEGDWPAGKMVKRPGPWRPLVRMRVTLPDWRLATSRKRWASLAVWSVVKARVSGVAPMWMLGRRLPSSME